MKYKITGENKIIGEINISGSKNASLPIIIASLLTKEKVILNNVPLITDVINLIRLLDDLGVNVDYRYEQRQLIIQAKKVKNKVTSRYVEKLRATYYLMGVLLARTKYVEMPYPGGCNFSKRPIDAHLYAFSLLGVKVIDDINIKLKVLHLTPSIVDFPLITVGGTINTILLTVLSDGVTILNNIAIEPEVIDVINFLNSMGADITFIGNNTIKIKGVKKLHATTYEVMPDRIEAGSYLLLALSSPNSKVTLNNIRVNDLKNIIDVLENLGCVISASNNKITLESPTTINNLSLEIGPYPKFPTDLQPILSVVLLNAGEESIIKDKVYIDRITHLNELTKMNAIIKYENQSIIIYPSKLNSAIVNATDLRCAFALIVAGNMSSGETIINNMEYLSRGYENCLKKLRQLNLICCKEL